MLNKILIPFFLMVFWTVSIYAQNTYAIQGEIIDQENQPVSAGNILVLSKEDNSMIQGAAFWDGSFQVEGIVADKFIVKIVALGYIDQLVEIDEKGNNSTINIGRVQLKLKDLETVVVSAKKLPTFKQYGDRMVVNLENSALFNGTSITDVLQKMPRVITDENGNVSVFGKGRAAVFIDGKKIVSNDILNAISPEEVKQIEIITNPSAKYEASGKAIINISTKKNKLNGYRSRVLLGFTQKTYLQKFLSTSVNYKKDQINLYLRFAANPNRRDYYEDDYERIFDGTTRLNQGIEKFKNFKHRYFYTAGLDYSLGANSTLGFEYGGSFKEGIENASNNNLVTYDTEDYLNVETLTNTKNQSNLNTYNLSYDWKPDSTKQYFNAKLDYTMYSQFKNDDIDEFFTGNAFSNSKKRNYGNNDVGIVALQSNYLHPFESIDLDFETGIKYTNINNQSSISFDVIHNEVPVVVPERSNNYEYTEQVGAGYFLLMKEIGKWYMKAGLRAEYTLADGYSNALGQTVVDNEYLNLFPSASVRYDLSKDLDVALSYSKRIERPTIQELDPFQFYIDSLTYYKGNPSLRPEITHASDLTVTYKKYASISTGYSLTNNPMFLFVEQEQENSLVSVASMKNIKKSTKYFASVNIPYQIKFWTTFNVVGFEINDFSYDVNGIDVNRSKPLWYFYFHNDFKLKKGWSLELNYRHTTAGANGIFEFQPRSNVSFAINKSLLNKKMNVSLSANDIFNKDRLRSSTVLNNLQLKYNSFYDNQYVRLNIRYKFGKLKKVSYKKKTSNRTDVKRIKQ